jgi:hypothetical protein
VAKYFDLFAWPLRQTLGAPANQDGAGGMLRWRHAGSEIIIESRQSPTQGVALVVQRGSTAA